VSDCNCHRNVVTVHRAVTLLVEDVVFVAVVVHFAGFVGQGPIVQAAVRVADRSEICRKYGDIQIFGNDTDISQLFSRRN
jgi:hypothetical protein